MEEINVDGKPAMKVVFIDGIEAPVTRAFMDESRFDIWLPPEYPDMAATIIPKVDENTAMGELSKLATKAAKSI